MQWLRENFPPFSQTWDLPFGTLTDLIGIGVGLLVLCMTGWIAFRQFRIMNKQTKLIEEQNEASSRIERLTVEQAAIAKRQGEIAEIQHRLTLEHASRMPDLRIYERHRTVNLLSGTKTSMLVLHNLGQLAVQWYEWEIWARASSGAQLAMFLADGEKVHTSNTMFDSLSYIGTRERITNPLHPHLDVECVAISGVGEGIVEVRWAASSDQGRFPAKGHGILTLEWEPVDNPLVDNSESTT